MKACVAAASTLIFWEEVSLARRRILGRLPDTHRAHPVPGGVHGKGAGQEARMVCRRRERVSPLVLNRVESDNSGESVCLTSIHVSWGTGASKPLLHKLFLGRETYCHAVLEQVFGQGGGFDPQHGEVGQLLGDGDGEVFRNHGRLPFRGVVDAVAVAVVVVRDGGTSQLGGGRGGPLSAAATGRGRAWAGAGTESEFRDPFFLRARAPWLGGTGLAGQLLAPGVRADSAACLVIASDGVDRGDELEAGLCGWRDHLEKDLASSSLTYFSIYIYDALMT